jgi:Flp pilus assembly protein TadD
VVQDAPEEREQVWRSESKKPSGASTGSTSPSQQATQAATFAQNRQKIDPATRAQIRELNQRGYQAMRNGNFGNAERFFKNVLKLEPTNPVAQQGLLRAQRRAAR